MHKIVAENNTWLIFLTTNETQIPRGKTFQFYVLTCVFQCSICEKGYVDNKDSFVFARFMSKGATFRVCSSFETLQRYRKFLGQACSKSNVQTSEKVKV